LLDVRPSAGSSRVGEQTGFARGLSELRDSGEVCPWSNFCELRCSNRKREVGSEASGPPVLQSQDRGVAARVHRSPRRSAVPRGTCIRTYISEYRRVAEVAAGNFSANHRTEEGSKALCDGFDARKSQRTHTLGYAPISS